MRAAIAALLLGAAWSAALAQAQRPNDRQIVELAGQGRYDELATGLAPFEDRLDPGERHALCYAYARSKRYRPLLACLDKLEAALNGRDRASLLFGLDDATATVPLMRAEALLDLGLPAEAAAEADKALAWFAKEGGAAERDLQLEALGLAALAAVRRGQPDAARPLLQKVQAASVGARAGPNVANARTLALARGHLALGDYKEACAALEADRGFDARRQVELWLHGRPANWVWVQMPRLFMLARCRQGMGRTAEAKADYDELLKLPALRQNQGIHWLVLSERGQIAADEGDREGAIRLWRDAIDVIERQRSSIDTEAAKIGFVADKQTVYGRLVGALLEGARAVEALEIIERAKARVLVDLLADRQAGAAAKQAPPLLARSDVQLAAMLERHRAAEEALQVQLPARSESLFDQQRRDLAAATTGLRQASPALASLVTVAPVSTAELVRQLDGDELGLQYYQVGTRLYALVFGAQGTKAFTLDGTGLLADIRDFRAAITQRTPKALALARKLHARLIAPLAGALGNKPLLIVPHAGLHYLPFGALHDGQRFVIEQHALRVTASASALQYLRRDAPAQRTPVLILGDPTQDLPSARSEAQRLGRLLPGATVLVGAAATRAAFVAAAPRARTVHIAGHAVFDAQNPLRSRLLLAPAGADNGEMRVGDLYGMELGADLVTLSACETGLGRITDGGEVIGLIRGFQYAGAGSVVASLWQVPDEETALLMERFYANLPRLGKRDALRAAQIELLRRSAEPFYWAAFYLSGNPR